MRWPGFLLSIAFVAACGSSVPIGGGTGGSAAAGAAGTGAGGRGGAGQEVPTLHRPIATVCPSDRPAPMCQQVPAGAPPLNFGNCRRDTDCNSGQNGRCGSSSPNDANCDVCSYDECFSDSDCSAGGPCDCRSAPVAAANACSAGNCRVDADCGEGGYCSPSRPRCPYPGVETATVGWFCRTAKDTCLDDADCKKPNTEQECRYDGAAGFWRCFDYPGCPT